MTQTASNARGPQLTVSAPGPSAPAQDAVLPVEGLAAAAGLAGPLAAGALAPELQPHLGLAAGLAEEGDVLSEVWRTSSYLESMQWELDNAQQSLHQAVRNASAAGVTRDELCTAANLTAGELAAVLMAATDSAAIQA